MTPISMQPFMLSHCIALRNGPSVVSRSIWHPFEARFENFCKRMDDHKEVLAHELHSVQMKGIAVTLEQNESKQAQLFDI